VIDLSVGRKRTISHSVTTADRLSREDLAEERLRTLSSHRSSPPLLTSARSSSHSKLSVLEFIISTRAHSGTLTVGLTSLSGPHLPLHLPLPSPLSPLIDGSCLRTNLNFPSGELGFHPTCSPLSLSYLCIVEGDILSSKIVSRPESPFI
jgi:hypothetical protein